jgi:hypothetical protein
LAFLSQLSTAADADCFGIQLDIPSYAWDNIGTSVCNHQESGCEYQKACSSRQLFQSTGGSWFLHFKREYIDDTAKIGFRDCWVCKESPKLSLSYVTNMIV